MTDDLFDWGERRAAAWAAAEEGAERAADHAESEDPGWKDAALHHVRVFALRLRGESFMIENVREYAEGIGFAPPPDNRAWGAVAIRAKKLGIVVSAGYGRTSLPPAHAHPANLWKLAA